MSDISPEAGEATGEPEGEPSGEPGDSGGTVTPNCVACSRGVAHRQCAVLRLLHGGWVIEHGSRRDTLAVAAVRADSGKARR